MMKQRFSKMHGIGNDFVVLDCRDTPFSMSIAQIRAMADRHTGIGFDQLLGIGRASDPSCAFYYGISNADGSPSGQCGNGVRCVAAWLHREGALAIGETVRIESPSGSVAVRLIDANEVVVDMGVPAFEPAQSGFDAARAATHYPIDVAGTTRQIGVVSMGNPHAVLEVDDLHRPEWERLSPLLSAHARFADGVNVCFVQRVDRGHLKLRVHERGAGWTLACGTGACAAMAVLHQRGAVDDSVQVSLPGGVLQIDWAGPGQPLWMSGSATFVFDGEWFVPEGLA
jgi:diaminopimelate epimerase